MPRTSRRTRVVWAAFGSAMTLVTGVLLIGGGGASGPRAFVAAVTGGADGLAPNGRFDAASDISADPIAPRDAALDRGRWKRIVIHHSGSPAGDPESIEREHLSRGYAGLGYHFIVGNGHGLGDGTVFVGPRWNRQQPGAHVSGANGPWMNEHAIGICLVGNGDRREFTDRQMHELVGLVRRLQQALGISATDVVLNSDVAQTESPGRFFPAADFESQLLR